jgi:DNA-binding transcriptional ArsR family regulator
MAHAPAPADPFLALAEPRRRRLLMHLAQSGEQPVNDLVAALGWPQPTVSKHLAVLRQAGLVGVTRDGRQRRYAVRPEEIRTVNDWLTSIERLVGHQADRIKRRAEAAAAGTTPPPPTTPED